MLNERQIINIEEQVSFRPLVEVETVLGLKFPRSISELFPTNHFTETQLEDIEILLRHATADSLIEYRDVTRNSEVANDPNQITPPRNRIGLLLLISISNLVDSIFESGSSPFQFRTKMTEPIVISEMIDIALGISINFDGQLLSISEILELISKSFPENGSKVITRMIEIFVSQLEYSQKIKNRSIDEAIDYRATTLGKYFSLLTSLSQNDVALKKMSERQMFDDAQDIADDLIGLQIQPFSSIMDKYHIPHGDVYFEEFEQLGEFLLLLSENKAFNFEEYLKVKLNAQLLLEKMPKITAFLKKEITPFLLELRRILTFYLVEHMRPAS